MMRTLTRLSSDPQLQVGYLRQFWIILVLCGLLAACTTSAPAPAAPVPTATLTASAPAATATSHSTPLPNNPSIRVEEGHVLTPTPQPTLPPEPPYVFSQMTSGGCCVQPFFSPDGARVLYLDKPRPDASTGLWSVPVSQPLAAPTLFSQRLGPFSPDMSLNEFLQGGRTVVERASDGKQWVIDNGGRRVSFSPDGKRIAWVVGEEAGNFDVRESDIWLANVDGSSAREVATLYGGGVQGWMNDSARLLVSGKTRREDITRTLGILSLNDGSASIRTLIDVDRLRAMLLSPGDRYIVYNQTQAIDASNDGTFVLDLTQDKPVPRRLDFFGAYQWCSPTRLYYIPLKLSAPGNELWVLDVPTGQARQIIPATVDSPFKIGNGDWDVSPDGGRIVFLNAHDHNIWMVTLRDACYI